MKELIKDVRRVMKDELDRANKEFPLFRSNHEGLGVLVEEVYEADNAGERTKDAFARLTESIFTDDDKAAKRRAKRLRENAVFAACEFIQVAAMADKFLVSSNDRFSQEHADYLAETCPEAVDDDIFIDAPSFLKHNEAVMDACRKLAEVIEKAEEDENAK